MDTSPEYIKQCEKAKEIQLYRNGRKKDGDFYYFPRFKETHALSGFPPATQESFIWLPRQDQLQMLSGLSWQEFDRECLKYDAPTKEQAGIQVVMKILAKTTR